MDRREKAAIVGSYSRQGFDALYTMGGFWVTGLGFRTCREARKDTGVIQFLRARREEIRLAYKFDLR